MTNAAGALLRVCVGMGVRNMGGVVKELGMF